MDEKQIERALADRLRAAKDNPKSLSNFIISESISAPKNLAQLIENRPFTIFEDDNTFNQNPQCMIDIIGNMIPDIVVRSSQSKENRIYIEVKLGQSLGYGKHDSQIIRYFLHLLSTTTKLPKGQPDISRAVLLAAPSDWFQNKKNGEAWQYFLDKYTDIAKCFDVTLGKLEIDDLIKEL